MNALRIYPLQGRRKEIHDIAEQLTEALPKDVYDAFLKGVDENGKLALYFSKNCAWGVMDTRSFARVEFFVLSEYIKNGTIYVSSQEALDNFIKENTMSFDMVINDTNYKADL